MSSVQSARYRAFLRQLRAAREEAGLTQAEVARRLRKRQTFVSKCELGERRVDATELVDFCRIYKKPARFFLPELQEFDRGC